MGMVVRGLTMLLLSALFVFHVSAETYLISPPHEKPKLDASAVFGTSMGSGVFPDNSLYIPLANVIVADLTDDDAARLKSLGWMVVEDYNITMSPYRIDAFIPSNESLAGQYWNLRWIEADKVWKLGLNGSGVRIAVIDTGVALHPDLRDRVALWKDFVNNRTSPYDDNGHGTHVAGIIAGEKTGVAPGSDLLIAKVFDRNGAAPLSRILSALQWASENGADVVSYSAGLVHIDRFTGKGFLASYNSSNRHLFRVLEYRGEPAFKPASVVVYISSPQISNLSVSLFSPSGEVRNLTPMSWLSPGDDAYYFRVGSSYFAGKYTSPAPLESGNWSLVVSPTNVSGNTTRSLQYLFTVLVVYQSDGTSILDVAVNNLVSNGTVFVAAAGNDGMLGFRTINTPGTAGNALTVGAIKYKSDQIADFSSKGPVWFYNTSVKPDVVAPGERIASTYYSPWRGYTYAQMSGTSMAVPHVSGVVALMLQANPALTPEQIMDVLRKTSVDLGVKGSDCVYGWGRISALSAVLEVMNESHSRPVILFARFSDSLTVNESETVIAVAWNRGPVSNVSINFAVRCNGSEILNVSEITDWYGIARAVFVPNQTGLCFITISDEFGDRISGSIYVGMLSNVFTLPLDFVTMPNETVRFVIPFLAENRNVSFGVVRLVIGNSTSEVVNESANVSDGFVSLSVNLSETTFDDHGWKGEIHIAYNSSSLYAGRFQVVSDPYVIKVIPWGTVNAKPGQNLTYILHAFNFMNLTPWNLERSEINVTWFFDNIYENVESGNLKSPASVLHQSEIREMYGVVERKNVTFENGIGVLNVRVPENALYGVIDTASSESIVDVNSPSVWRSYRSESSILDVGVDWNCTSVCEADVYAVVGNESIVFRNETVYFYTSDGARSSKTNEYGVAHLRIENLTGTVDLLVLHGNSWKTLTLNPPGSTADIVWSNGSVVVDSKIGQYIQVLRVSGGNGTEVLVYGHFNQSEKVAFGAKIGEYLLVTFDGAGFQTRHIFITPLNISIENAGGSLNVTSDHRGILYAVIVGDGGVSSYLINGTELSVPLNRYAGFERYYAGFSDSRSSFIYGPETIWFDIVHGDLDMDGILTEKDARILAEMISGMVRFNPAGDVNGDFEVDISDLTELLYYLWGKLETLQF